MRGRITVGLASSCTDSISYLITDDNNNNIIF